MRRHSHDGPASEIITLEFSLLCLILYFTLIYFIQFGGSEDHGCDGRSMKTVRARRDQQLLGPSYKCEGMLVVNGRLQPRKYY